MPSHLELPAKCRLLAHLYGPVLSEIISGCIGDAAQPRSEWRQWRQIVGLSIKYANCHELIDREPFGRSALNQLCLISRP
jgi:hypothetical protein